MSLASSLVAVVVTRPDRGRACSCPRKEVSQNAELLRVLGPHGPLVTCQAPVTERGFGGLRFGDWGYTRKFPFNAGSVSGTGASMMSDRSAALMALQSNCRPSEKTLVALALCLPGITEGV